MEFLSAMLPMAVFLAIGYIMKKLGLAGDDARTFVSKYLYYFAMPGLAFRSVASFGFRESFVPELVLHNLVTMTFMFLVSIGLMFLIKDRKMRGSAHMAVYRGNQAYIGMYAARGMFGELALSKSAVINGFENPLVNILAVTGMVILNGDEKNRGFGKRLLRILVDVARNPFVIAVLLGMAESVFSTGILGIGALDKTLELAGNTALPLALILIGTSMTFTYMKENLGLVLLLSSVKVILLPVIAWLSGRFIFGLTGADLGLGVVMLGTPVAVSSYVFAREMGADENLMASCIGISTILSIFTLPLINYII
ncbi:MAG TPA: AEC family transporter [Clostridia bacterium]|nr:AEC family transporter [Clostridia bacterium]HPQ47439.1 AEC family transporter [Clostridia bacterium]HRX42658.1 AEC family transporter [Clostridia bacterium]